MEKKAFEELRTIYLNLIRANEQNDKRLIENNLSRFAEFLMKENNET